MSSVAVLVGGGEENLRPPPRNRQVEAAGVPSVVMRRVGSLRGVAVLVALWLLADHRGFVRRASIGELGRVLGMSPATVRLALDELVATDAVRRLTVVGEASTFRLSIDKSEGVSWVPAAAMPGVSGWGWRQLAVFTVLSSWADDTRVSTTRRDRGAKTIAWLADQVGISARTFSRAAAVLEDAGVLVCGSSDHR